MDFISTPEGQEAMMADTGAMFSSLNDTDPPDVPEIESLIPVLCAGRYAVFGSWSMVRKRWRKAWRGC